MRPGRSYLIKNGVIEYEADLTCYDVLSEQSSGVELKTYRGNLNIQNSCPPKFEPDFLPIHTRPRANVPVFMNSAFISLYIINLSK